ncbi:hypothetical protein [Halomicrobium sp. LC1Hm]|uniref:hypothetical protein n=1 Tax=Halomicrobium sp. LC1Hm TaxID=2610902 RepID=UPI00129844C4|nr:hypothetical protein [Halomicrobium sp. LC1Hm]QGA81816.1 Uncharacterized protein LC1Hm_0754 [Halomicrobium sp. LC1Hm]
MPEYSGYLVFNQIYKLESEIDLEKFSKEFTFNTEQRGTPSEPQRSVSEVMLPARTVDEPLPREFLRILDEEVRWFKYTIEEFREQKGLDDQGEPATFYVRDERNCDIFVTSDGYLFFKGPSGIVDESTQMVLKRLETSELNTLFEEVEFTPDFLLWLMYVYNSNNSLPSKIQIKRLTDAKVIGDQSEFGKSNRVSGSVDASLSAPVLTGILVGKDMAMIGGIFNLEGVMLTVDVESDGRVHIKSGQDLSEFGSEGRIVSSITFLRELCILWEHWCSLPPNKKYPPDDFFINSYERLQSAGVNVDYNIDPVIDEYRQKRGE